MFTNWFQRIEQRMIHMGVDVARISTAVGRLHSDVQKLLADRQATQAKLDDISAQLAAAIAANDPVATKAVQDALDALAASLDADSDVIEGSATGATGPASPGV